MAVLDLEAGGVADDILDHDERKDMLKQAEDYRKRREAERVFEEALPKKGDKATVAPKKKKKKKLAEKDLYLLESLLYTCGLFFTFLNS